MKLGVDLARQVLAVLRHSVPPRSIVAESRIPGAGFGVFASVDIPPGTAVVLYPGTYAPPIPLAEVGATSGDPVLRPGEVALIPPAYRGYNIRCCGGKLDGAGVPAGAASGHLVNQQVMGGRPQIPGLNSRTSTPRPRIAAHHGASAQTLRHSISTGATSSRPPEAAPVPLMSPRFPTAPTRGPCGTSAAPVVLRCSFRRRATSAQGCLRRWRTPRTPRVLLLLLQRTVASSQCRRCLRIRCDKTGPLQRRRQRAPT